MVDVIYYTHLYEVGRPHSVELWESVTSALSLEDHGSEEEEEEEEEE